VFEDAIEGRRSGKCEVTGGGSGNRGSPIDLQIFDVATDIPGLLTLLRGLLQELTAPPDTVIDIGGQRYPLGS
jgi:hypothetical protein